MTIRGLTIASVPDSIGTVTPHVSGRRVTLTSEAVTGASDYIVEAGSNSGASNLAQIRTGGELHLVVDEVPSGTYFVHVRATNHVGTTAPSAELTVLAP